MKVLIFGAKGYIGSQFLSLFGDEAIASSIDIADATAVAAALEKHKPDVVINAAGKTGKPNIDWCEDHKEETIHSNVTGPKVLLEECGKRNIYWVHMSSGCIYEGDNGGSGFTEEDIPNFTGSFYSKTKGEIDQYLNQFPVLILRIRMPFDGSGNPRTLIAKLKKYDRVLDVPNSITYIPDFLAAAKALIEKKATGIYNIVNPGAMSPYQIMEKYRDIVDPSHMFEKLTLDDLPSVVKAGRSNCILNCEKLSKEGIELSPIETAVQTALGEMKTKAE
ncbi:MAG: sugar nucleotide-binding protein [bacterium]|nr:sugar nucleotide-binding protein [bacterium]